MQEETKYYTPTKSDWVEGLEYEYQNKWSPDWRKYTIDLDTSFSMLSPDGEFADDRPFNNESKFRIKCLDREDIEELGWRESHFSNGNYFHFDVMKGEERTATFRLHKSGEICIIDSYTASAIQLPSFQGWVKNKSELKKLMYQLGMLQV